MTNEYEPIFDRWRELEKEGFTPVQCWDTVQFEFGRFAEEMLGTAVHQMIREVEEHLARAVE